ncbi:MAG: ComEC/Rec2 family competence protein, partial [Acidimicrobiales bacterium]|nr:ComEC/Rec2 family competence protein [Acidimicrobiales bacterium]
MAAVALAVGVVAGATLARPVPGPVLAALAVGLVRWRRPVALVLLAAALASTWGAAAHRGLAPAPAGRHHGWVTLLTDPSPVASGVQVEVRLGRRHVEAWARGGASGSLRARLSGEQVLVTGRLRPLTDPGAWQVARHLSGRLEIDVVEGWRPGTPPVQAANRLHRLLARGAADLPDDTRALFLGFVLGDDRGRSELVTDDFRGAGLMHLLAVSGQNVAFVLALFAPALRRLGLRSRFVATLALLAFFALLTRFEPSVLRATAMAAIAT